MGKYREISKNTIIQIFGKSISTIIGVATTILLTRYLGPTGFGQFTFIAVFLTLFGVISDWGFNLIAIREASQKPNEQSNIISNAFTIKIGLGFLAALLANICANIFNYSPEIRLLVLIGSFQLIMIAIKTSCQIIFNVALKLENWAISEIVGNIIVLLGTIVFVLAKQNLINYFFYLNLAYLASALTAFILARKFIDLKLILNKSRAKYLITQAVPMGTILILFTVYNRLDILMLEHFWGAQVVGWYGAAYRIFDVLVLGAAYFANALLPNISWQAEHDKKALAKTFKQAFFVLLIMGVIVATINFVLAPIGINLIAGPKFTPAIAALRILSFALVVSYFNHLTGYTLIALKRQSVSLKLAGLALSVNLILNLILIPRYSLYAAATTTFLTEALITSISLIYVYKYLH